jgi:hypothetical protein
MTATELTRAVLAAEDMGAALALIEAHDPSDFDPVEIYWTIVECAEMAAELSDDF